MYPAVLLIYFISAAVILLASLALTLHVSLPYNKTGRASVLYSFILVFLRAFCGLNTLFIIPVSEISVLKNQYIRSIEQDHKMGPVSILTRQLMKNFWLIAPHTQRPPVQQSGDYTPADRTKLYKKPIHKSTKFILL